MKRLLLLVGTKKGLLIFETTDRQRWNFQGISHNGKEVNHAVFDPRTRRLYATANDAWFGSEVLASADLGKTWVTAKTQPGFPAESGLKMDRIWHIEPGAVSTPGVLYAGIAPAALFRSDDHGENWSEVKALSAHPSRPHWQPGAGGLCLHSIVVDPQQSQRLFVGISAVGVFRTDDGGQSWKTTNKGTRAEFLPEKYPEYGQCVHKLLAAPGSSSLLFQQNHCGVYRSADAGENWQEITAGLPSDFGFPLAIHPREPETIFVVPLQGGEFRCPPGGHLRVYRSRDGGKSWAELSKGLPQEQVFVGIYREGMTRDDWSPAGVYFGTNTGKIFGSRDEGDSWNVVADNLPPVYSLALAAVD